MRGGQMQGTGWSVRGVMRRVMMLALLAGVGTATTMALAQAGEEGGAQAGRSFAKAFFGVEGSIVGTIKIWFLIGLSVVTLGLIIQRARETSRRALAPEGVSQKVRTAVAAKDYDGAISSVRGEANLLGVMLYETLKAAAGGYGAMLRALAAAEDAQVTMRLRRLEVLNVIGNVAPMIGLLGTVYGIILAFQEVVAAGGRPSPVELAGGIGTALVATFWGLLIAIPALSAYALLRNRLDAAATDAVREVEEVVGLIRENETKAQSGGAAS